MELFLVYICPINFKYTAMGSFFYNGDDNSQLDEQDVIMYIIWKSRELRKEGYDDDGIGDYFLSDDDLGGDRVRLIAFIKRCLEK